MPRKNKKRKLEEQQNKLERERKRRAGLNLVLQEFDSEVAARTKRLQQEANTLESKLRNALDVWLLQLPVTLRSLPIKVFCNEYKASISEFLQSQKKKERHVKPNTTSDSLHDHNVTRLNAFKNMKRTRDTNSSQSIKNHLGGTIELQVPLSQLCRLADVKADINDPNLPREERLKAIKQIKDHLTVLENMISTA